MLCTLALALAQSNPTIGGVFESHFQLAAPTDAQLFGRSVAGIGDINADGTPDFIVGAPGTDAPYENSGAAWVYSGADGSVLYHLPGKSDNQGFGARVSAAGDLNKDRVPDFLISAPSADGSWEDSAGKVWAYSGATGQLLYEFTGPFPYERIGFALCAAGDANKDGYDDFAYASSPVGSSGGSYPGAVYLRSGRDGSMLHTIHDPGTIDSKFGHAMTDMGDLNNDGHSDLAVGARDYSVDGHMEEGAVMIYSGATGLRMLLIEGLLIGEDFGCAVANAGDVTGDGVNDLLIGAEDDGWPTGGEGMVHLHSGADGALLLTIHGETHGGRFGAQVGVVDDINGDRVRDFVVNAPDEGAIRYLSGADGTELHKLDLQNAKIAVLGDVNHNQFLDLLVGQPNLGDGKVNVYGLEPCLRIGNDELSARRGGNIVMSLNFPAQYEGFKYKILVSASGTGPMTSFVDVPLSWDDHFRASLNGNYAGTLKYQLHGTLDANGEAFASWGFGNGFPKSMIGSTLWLAACVVSGSGKEAFFSSIARPVLITP